ncbi:MAG: BLUF domain-containing protein [Planctomycetes bacterium]|nr:BLUF domain-containing protein [Planctomycetota bacterium]
MKLVRLSYFSRALNDMTLMDIQSILDVARENNAALGICGMLCYESRWFLQVLEGERDEVNRLYLEIADDPRHDDIVLLGYEYPERRLFEDWRMGYAGSEAGLRDVLREHGLDRFEPGELGADEALRVLCSLSRRQSDLTA